MPAADPITIVRPAGDAASSSSAASIPAGPLRAAVIGSGKISEEHLRFLSASRRASLVGVCDLSPAMAKYGVDRFGHNGTTIAFTDHRELLREKRPAVVHVLTPPHTHVMLVTECLEAGAHVIVEKPAAPTNAEFRALMESARRFGRRVVEDHNYRFNRPILAIERLQRDGKLGEVREVEVRMALPIHDPMFRYADPNLRHPILSLPAGAIHDFITHLAYLLLRFMPATGNGADFSRVHAIWSNHTGNPVLKDDDLDATVLIGDVHGRIRLSSVTAPDTFAVTVRGTRGFAETDLFQPHLRVAVPRPGGKQLTPLVNQFVSGCTLAKASVVGFKNKVMQHTPYEGLATFLDRTYAALRAGTEPPVTFDDMDRTSRLVDALVAQQGGHRR
jgi:predicted dehydrogenase